MDEGFPFSDFQLKPFVDPKPVELEESYRGYPLHTDLREIRNQCEVKSV